MRSIASGVVVEIMMFGARGNLSKRHAPFSTRFARVDASFPLFYRHPVIPRLALKPYVLIVIRFSFP